MFLDAWNELLGIRIQPAVDLGEKKKTLVRTTVPVGEQEVVMSLRNTSSLGLNPTLH